MSIPKRIYVPAEYCCDQFLCLYFEESAGSEAEAKQAAKCIELLPGRGIVRVLKYELVPAKPKPGKVAKGKR